jgi:hypothetical protein
MHLDSSQTFSNPPAVPWEVPLRDSGFQRAGRAYHLGGLQFAWRERWLVLSEESLDAAELHPAGDLGQPGLWKHIPWAQPSRRVFEIPAWTVGDTSAADALEDGVAARPGQLLAWALATRKGQPPPAWQPPDAVCVRSWLPPGALTVQARGCVRQGELLLTPSRWALRFPILAQLPATLSEPRRHALSALAAETQARWAMVRVAVTAGTQPAAMIAEVDFTGAPPAELLFSAGVEVLRHVVAWLVETVEVLGDPQVEIQTLSGNNNTQSKTRNIP